MKPITTAVCTIALFFAMLTMDYRTKHLIHKNRPLYLQTIVPGSCLLTPKRTCCLFRLPMSRVLSGTITLEGVICTGPLCTVTGTIVGAGGPINVFTITPNGANTIDVCLPVSIKTGDAGRQVSLVVTTDHPAECVMSSDLITTFSGE